MRRADHLLKTMTALRDCLDKCLHDATPLQALSNCLQELRLNPEWTDAEIAEVESTARRALAVPTIAREKSGLQSTSVGKEPCSCRAAG
jgi:hypothetical protein